MTVSLDRVGFVPPIIWVPTDSGYRAVDRSTDPTGWAAAVEADAPVVTQVDDGATAVDGIGRSASSSSSQPSVVESMLDAAELRPGHRVLEVGTGTGWTAGLLARRLGSADVVTIEVDAEVAEQARHALTAAGLRPLVVVGDGEQGFAECSPYDRVLATCAVGVVPWPWVEQTRLDGMIVTPWGTGYHNGMLARLVRTGVLRAEGAFDDVPLAFMRLRSQRRRRCPWAGDGPGQPVAGVCELSSEDVYGMIAPPGAFAIGLLLPDCHKVVDEQELIVRLHDPASGSWARCTVTPGAPRHPVAEYGPRSLWREASAARSWWTSRGRPGPSRFGLTVTPDGQQVWLDEPGHPVDE